MLIGLLFLAVLACGLPGQVEVATPGQVGQPPAEQATSAPPPAAGPETAEPTMDAPAIPSDLARIRPSTAHLLQQITSHTELPVRNLVFAPDMASVAIINSSGVHVLSWPSLEPIRDFANEEEHDFPYAISQDGTTLAWRVRPETVQVVDLTSGATLLSLSGMESCCHMIGLSHDGVTLALMVGNSAKLWSIPSGEELFTIDGVSKFSISPDGQTLATNADSALSVSLWDMQDGKLLRDVRGFSTAAPVYSTMLSPDWETMVWISRASMQFSDVPSGDLGAEFIGSWGRFSPNGEVLAVVEDGWYGDDFLGDVMLFASGTGEQLGVLEHEDKPRALKFSADGSVLGVAVQDKIAIWDTSRWDKLATLSSPEGDMQDLFFSPDGRVLATVAGGSDLSFWAIPLGEGPDTAISTLNAEFIEEIAALNIEGATDVTFAPAGSFLAVATQNGDVEIWDWDLGQPSYSIPAHDDWIYGIRYSPTDKRIATASKDGTIRFWDVINGQLLVELDPDGGEATSLAYSVDGELLASGHEDGKMRLWDASTGAAISTLGDRNDWLWGVDLSPNGQIAASGSAGGTARLWDLNSANELATFEGHSSAVWDVAFSPDGLRVATSSWDGSVILWNVITGDPIREFRGHTDWIYRISFSPSGDLLATASKDGTVRIWEVASGAELRTLEGHSDQVWSVGFSTDGSLLASASSDGTVRVWGYLP